MKKVGGELGGRSLSSGGSLRICLTSAEGRGAVTVRGGLTVPVGSRTKDGVVDVLIRLGVLICSWGDGDRSPGHRGRVFRGHEWLLIGEGLGEDESGQGEAGPLGQGAGRGAVQDRDKFTKGGLHVDGGHVELGGSVHIRREGLGEGCPVLSSGEGKIIAGAVEIGKKAGMTKIKEGMGQFSQLAECGRPSHNTILVDEQGGE